MTFRLVPVFLAAAFVAAAQAPATTPAPAEVDQALRSRVTEFFQYHVDGGPALRKAFEMVAEDTKDEYFGSSKMQVIRFKIDGIKYAEGFENATVTVDVSRVWSFGGYQEEVTLPMDTTWKIEEGKWVWYHDKSLDSITPMGVSNLSTMKFDEKKVELIRQNEDGTVKLPENLGDQKTILAHAQAILGQFGLDRDQVHLSATKASEESVTFKNDSLGSVILELGDVPDTIPGLKVTLDKNALSGQDSAAVRVAYNPPSAEEGAKVAARLSSGVSIRLLMLPFNREFRIGVFFDADQIAAQEAQQ